MRIGAKYARNEWRRWFAWFWVRIHNREGYGRRFHWVWLEFIQRREFDDPRGNEFTGWQYKK